MINIISNGSKWMGQAPDPIETLFERLAVNTLCPSFERYGNFITKAHGAHYLGSGKYADLGPIYPDAPKAQRFSGNFFDVSAVFTIDTDDSELIVRLRAAIRKNQRTDAYKAARAQTLKETA